jgi:hypothetical protein
MSVEESEARAQLQSAALQEIFRRTYEATKYGRTINVHPDQVLLQQIREIAREALI